MTASDVTVWVDGWVGPAAESRINATDHGITTGDGVFETCKIVNGLPFALTRHLTRLARSAAVLDLECPEPSRVEAAAKELLSVAGTLPLGRLRIILTGGPGPLGSERARVPSTLIVAASAARPWPDWIGVVTVPWPRNERSAIAGAKTTSYAENVVALAAAHRAGAHEALLPNTRGELCEGTGSNVVIERDGQLVTPPLSSGCLAGITRELFLEWAADDGLPVVEDVVTSAELARAPQVLLTSSTRDVQHVSGVDGRALDGTALGKAARELFARRAAENINP